MAEHHEGILVLLNALSLPPLRPETVRRFFGRFLLEKFGDDRRQAPTKVENRSKEIERKGFDV
jgi:hypothetical protein